MSINRKMIMGLGLATALFPATQVLANGYEFLHQSAEGLGTAYATNGTAGNDISTLYSNPASIVRFDGTRVSSSLVLDFPRSTMDQASATAPYSNGTVAVSGQPATPTQFIDTAFGGGAYMTHQLNTNLVIGLALNAPFAYTSDYGETAVTRYTATKTTLQATNISPSFAYQLNEHWSVGGSLNFQYYQATLGTMVATSVTNPQVSTDVKSDIEGADLGFGYTLGFEYQATSQTRFGASYRSSIKHSFDGTVKFTGTAANLALLSAAAPSLTAYEGSAKFEIATPFLLQMGLLHQLNDKLELYANAKLTGWSAFKDTQIVYDNGLADTVVDNGWSNSWFTALGMGYQYSDKIKLRTGAAYDWSPTPADTVSPRAPNNDRMYAGVGLSYQYSDDLKLDFGYQYIKFKEVTIALADGNNIPRGTLDGKVNLYANVFMGQMNYRF